MRRHPKSTALAALTVAGAALVGFAGEGSAATLATATSPNEAGYTAAVQGSTFALRTQFVVPSLVCTSTLSGISPGAYLTTTASMTGGGVLVECSHGSAVYEAFALINGTTTTLSALTVAAGDDIIVTTAVQSASSAVTVEDVTKMAEQRVKGAGSAPTQLLVGETAVAGKTRQLPVPQFGKIRFSTTQLNRLSLGSLAPVRVNMVTASKVVQIKAEKLSTTGAAFNTTFAHA